MATERETGNAATSDAAASVVAGKPDACALLETANSASERVAGLHIAFLAICAYVLVIVFGTTDLDLLTGKGVTLPVVNAEVPIAGFYAFVPYLVVLAHFNLLLQLQLLSRKLFAFDAAAPREEGLGGFRDRLHIFPYTYYLVGRPSPLVRPLIGLMVSITLVLLPFATLLALQLQFLPAQDEAVTWSQRIAVWLDVLLVAILWPLILHPRDDWRSYWQDLIAAHVPRRRVWLALVLLIPGFVFFLFGAGVDQIGASLLLLVLSPSAVLALRGLKATSGSLKLYLFLIEAGMVLFLTIFFLFRLPDATFPLFLLLPFAMLWNPKAPRGSLALLLALFIGPLMPLALLSEGEGLEQLVMNIQGPPGHRFLEISDDMFYLKRQRNVLGRYTVIFSEWLLKEKRRLHLHEQILLAKPPKPETLAMIRSGRWQESLNQIEPINLQGRNLRHAVMSETVLVGADLREAQLQGASLEGAVLQGARLWNSQLAGANLKSAKLAGANLDNANLTGANMEEADLDGASLKDANLRKANLGGANLVKANFLRTQLQDAYLRGARLRGAILPSGRLGGAILNNADLRGAQLWEADLRDAILEGADLKGANLRHATLEGANFSDADLRDASLEGASLRGANLRDARLEGANLKGADLQGAYLTGARLPAGYPRARSPVEK